MLRREFLKQTIFSSAALGLGAGLVNQVHAAKNSDKPNIIFVIVDDLGYADLGCYGSKAIQTPHLDRMAKQGMKFTDAYSGCTVCAPARSTLMTGTHMGHTSVRSNAGGVSLLASDVTVAEVLKKTGYTTGGFGKWGIGDIQTEGTAEKKGFDEFFGYYHQVHAHYYYPDSLIHNGKHTPLPGNKDFYKHNKGMGGKPSKDHGHERQFTHYLIRERMFDWIKQNKDQPFFCYAPWTIPHGNYELPADDPGWQKYKDRKWSVKAKVHAAFTDMLDRDMGQLFKLLKQLDIDKNTIVFFCSDNGADARFEGTLDSSGPLKGFKRSMYEGGIKVPLIARWPGHIKPGSVNDLPCYFPDMMPTFADLAGASAYLPKKIDGLSILPSLTNQPDRQKKHDYLYWEWPPFDWRKRKLLSDEQMAAIRKGKWKAVRHHPTKPIELYDLTKDPGETKNLAKQHPDLIKQFDTLFKQSRVSPRHQPDPSKPKGQRWR